MKIRLIKPAIFLNKCLCFLYAVEANDWQNCRPPPLPVPPAVRVTGLKLDYTFIRNQSGGGQHSLAGEGAGRADSDDWRESLALCLLCDVYRSLYSKVHQKSWAGESLCWFQLIRLIIFSCLQKKEEEGVSVCFLIKNIYVLTGRDEFRYLW
jgi:hypothetical protein